MSKFLREGRGHCRICDREVDLVSEPKIGLTVSRHLHKIEEYGPKGAKPTGFCPGSLTDPKPRTRP